MTTATHPAMHKRSLQFSGLDLLRFAAAMIVMFYHLGLVVAATAHPLVEVSYRALRPFAWPGWIGVEIFFTLSGFIISFSAQGATASTFAKGRFIRLYPTAWACALVTAIVLVATHGARVGPNLIYRLLNTDVLFTKGPYLDPSYWTLETELRFYLIVLLLLLIGQMRRLIPVISAFGLLSTASQLVIALGHADMLGSRSAELANHLSTPLGNVLNRVLLLDYGCYFAIGSLLWSCLLQRVSTARIVLLLLCCCGAVAGIVSHAAQLSGFLSTDYSPLPALAYWLVAVAGIIASVRFHTPIAGWLGEQGTRIARLLGLMTYPLYLLHQEIGYRMLGVLHGRIPDVAALLGSVLTLILLSYLVHTYAELPMQRWFRGRLFSARRPAAVSTATLP